MTQRLVAWGAYDDSKPRVRLLLAALRRAGALDGEIHVPVWHDVADKSVAGKGALLRAALRYVAGMPRALWWLARHPGQLAILLPYPGTPDIFLAALIARVTGRRLVLDAFLPIHDTIVRDRAMVRAGGWRAAFVRWFERAGLRRADVILTDTDAQADFLAREYAIDRQKFVTVLVGAEELFLDHASGEVADLLGAFAERRFVLFYGQFIPLHGLATILEAAHLSRDDGFAWVVVGSGQQDVIMREHVAREERPNLHWIKWVDYVRLPDLIAKSELCLGIFGSSNKAARVIPNKLFQTLAMGKRVITRSSPAIADLAERFPDAIRTVPAEDPEALAEVVRQAMAEGESGDQVPAALRTELSPDAGVARLIAKLEGL